MMTTRMFYGFALTVLSLAAVARAADNDAAPAPLADSLVAAEQQRVDTIASVVPSVVCVFAPSGSEGGSGVLVSPDGYVLTNYHVALGTGPWAKCGLSDGAIYDAVVVGVDPTGDVALMKMFGRDDFPVAEFGNSDTLSVGDRVFVMGNPFMLADDLQPTVTAGIVSGVRRYQYPSGTFLEYTDCIQTDASINPGNSGGPLFDANGRLVGINGRASFEKRGRINVGVGYAISINQARNFLGALRGGWIVDHASLGATVQTDGGGRAIVSNVATRSDVQRRGLRFGDEVVEFGGRDITDANSLKNVLGIYPTGWRVPLTYRRDNQWHDILVRLEPLHSPEELIAQWQPDREKQPALQIRLPMPDDESDDPDAPQPETPQPKKPRPAQPMPDDGTPTTAAIAHGDWPAVVREHYETRSGFANYYFNRGEQRRLWQALGQPDDAESTGGAWRIDGAQAFGGAVRLVIGNDKAAGTFGSQPVTASLDDLASNEKRATDNEALLLALCAWCKLVRTGESATPEAVYLGAFPLDADGKLYDTLELRFEGWRANAMVDTAAGTLTALEVYPASGDDPIELRFADYRTSSGTTLPHTIHSVRAGTVIETITVDDYTLDLDADAVMREATSATPAGD